jgi:hypothetical protein
LASSSDIKQSDNAQHSLDAVTFLSRMSLRPHAGHCSSLIAKSGMEAVRKTPISAKCTDLILANLEGLKRDQSFLVARNVTRCNGSDGYFVTLLPSHRRVYAREQNKRENIENEEGRKMSINKHKDDNNDTTQMLVKMFDVLSKIDIPAKE